MRLSKLFHASAFRLALGYVALFVTSGAAVALFVVWTSEGLVGRQIDATIDAEITGLAERYRRAGVAGLSQVVRERSRNQRLSLYLLAGPDRRPLVGNLDGWPPVQTQDGGWLDFVFDRPAGQSTEEHQARGRHLQLAGGFQLLVGRDVQERREIAQLVRRSLIWALVLTLGLGLAGGVLTSRNMLRRVDAINTATNDIMAGDLGRRLPVTGVGDELDRLAANLNGMLDQIERLMSGMRQVTDNLAHDLRSPLARLRSRLELALMEQPSVASYREALERTNDDAEDLLSTFNALLLIAQAEAGSIPATARALVDLGDLARGVADLYEPAAEAKGVAFALEVAGTVLMDGSFHLLSQALANLVDNAVKYTPAGGRVAVAARGSGEDVLLIVADTGPGIPEQDRVRVLDRFVRLDASRHHPGSGLGLSLAKAVVELHGGVLRLEDNLPGLRVVARFHRGEASAHD